MELSRQNKILENRKHGEYISDNKPQQNNRERKSAVKLRTYMYILDRKPI